MQIYDKYYADDSWALLNAVDILLQFAPDLHPIYEMQAASLHLWAVVYPANRQNTGCLYLGCNLCVREGGWWRWMFTLSFSSTKLPLKKSLIAILLCKERSQSVPLHPLFLSLMSPAPPFLFSCVTDSVSVYRVLVLLSQTDGQSCFEVLLPGSGSGMPGCNFPGD